MKLLYVLGGHFEHAKYIGIKVEEGDIRKLVNHLKRLRRTYDEISLILDINQNSRFPSNESDFWDFFKVNSNNSLLVILHKRNEEIEDSIKKLRSTHSISGPLYYRYILQDGTPVSDIEREIILHSIYMIFPQSKKLHGVLSLRIYLPFETLQLPNKIERLYQELLSNKITPKDMNLELVDSDLDITQFKSVIQFNPFLNIDINNDDHFEIPEGYIDRLVEENFNKDRYSSIRDQLKSFRQNVINEKINNVDIDISAKGANKLINFYAKVYENIKKKLSKLRNTIRARLRIIDLCKKQTKENLTEVVNEYQAPIEDELQEFRAKYATFPTFLKSDKLSFVLFILLNGLTFVIAFLILHLQLEYSLILSTIIAVSCVFIRYRYLRKKSITQFYELCELAGEKLKNELQDGFLNVPKKLWERNLYLFNLKLLKIKEVYITLTLHTLKLLTETSPMSLMDNIFSTKNRMIFFAPSSRKVGDITIDEIETYLSMDKNDIDNYFIDQFFKGIVSLKIGTVDKNVINSINDYCLYPDKGLLWDSGEVIESRRDNYFSINLYHPDTIDFEIPKKSITRVDDLNDIHYELSLQSIILIGLFHFKDEETL